MAYECSLIKKLINDVIRPNVRGPHSDDTSQTAYECSLIKKLINDVIRPNVRGPHSDDTSYATLTGY
jgi:predicted Rdx family selenoprotein